MIRNQNPNGVYENSESRQTEMEQEQEYNSAKKKLNTKLQSISKQREDLLKNQAIPFEQRIQQLQKLDQEIRSLRNIETKMVKMRNLDCLQCPNIYSEPFKCA